MKKDRSFYKDYDLRTINKNVLLEDFDLTERLANFNNDFGKHPLAQDMDVLMLGNGVIASGLAWNSDDNGWGETEAAQQLKVLRLQDGRVAWYLALFSSRNGWGGKEAAQNIEVLELETKYTCFFWFSKGNIAVRLAKESGENGWAQTPAAQNLKVLGLCGGRVVYELMKRFPGNGWRKSFMGVLFYYFVLFRNNMVKDTCKFVIDGDSHEKG